jgi:uncharacterized membrane protein HdeD (DUF308 family)
MTRLDSLLARAGGNAEALCRRTWWVFLIGGLAAVVFGVLAMAQPVAAWLVVAAFFAAAILVDGIFNVVGSLRNRDKDSWWILLLLGVLGVVVGGYALLNPLVSMAAFVFLVAFQAILFGALIAMLGYKVRASTEREWVLYLIGALSILFGVLIVVNPAAGAVSVIWLIAAWAIATGVLRIVFAFRARSLAQHVASVR